MESKKPLIFYGAGRYAESHLHQWIKKGICPACFADIDEKKHFHQITLKGVSPEGGTGYDILPLNEAIKRYPDYEIFISASYDFPLIMDYLLDKGIERTRFYRLQSGSKWCPVLGTDFIIHGPGVQTCCRVGAFCLPSKGNIIDDLKQYKSYCDFLINQLNDDNGLYTPCEDCYMLCDGKNRNEDKIKTVNLSSGLPGGDHCNFTCVYCVYGKEFNHYRRDDNVSEIFQYLQENIKPEHIAYACGEITISPYRDRILQLWKENKLKGQILTNAAIYNQDIFDLLATGQISINCSIDAGTRETFEKIKGKDCYYKVLDNLEKYASSGGKIQLKYILLNGINSNEHDIMGFIQFSKKIGAEVVLSPDNRKSNEKMSHDEYDLFMRFINCCKQYEINYSIIEAYSPEDLDAISEV